jgi:hypothetical protein
MQLKHLECLKALNDNDIQYIIDSSFSYHTKNLSMPADVISNIGKGKCFSSLVRFYRSLNSNKKIEEEQAQQALRELIKNKDIVTSLWEKINSLQIKQLKRFKFGEIAPSKTVLICGTQCYLDNIISNVKRFCNITWRINICITNHITNRVIAFNI